ncbi:MAG: hypothetical protein GXO32_03245 [Crenarchaeota archaeon]|nr:hypothetical protein [Thermoproteota archaeon]
MLGRRFQYAFLSFADNVDVRPDLNIASFESKEEFVKTVRLALETILASLMWPETTRKKSKCPPYRLSKIGYELECTRLDRGPNLYQAGKKSDYRTLQTAGLNVCKYINQKCQDTVAWIHAAVSYALLVLEKGGPIGGEPEYDILWLARATLFTMIRNVKGAVEAKDKKINIDTLGTVLLGGAISYLGSQKVSDQQLEFYVLPEYVSRAYRALRQIAAVGGITSNLAAKVADLTRNLSVSFEQAVALATAVFTIKYAHIATKLGISIGEALGSGKLYTIQTGNRAQVRAGVPLSNLLREAYRGHTLEKLDWFVGEALRQGDKDAASAAKNAASTCIHSLFLQALAGVSGELYLKDCMRDLLAVYEYDKSSRELKRAARSLLSSLESEATRIILRARG